MRPARLAGESSAYQKLRDELQEAEIALRDQRERVAELRRSLPRDHAIPDVAFEEIVDGARREVRLSELFTDPGMPLVLMHFMFGKAQEHPCPMCTMWADGYAGVQHHLAQRINFAVCVAGDVGAFGSYARERGWGGLRLVSSAPADLKRDLGFELENGAQLPGVSVFELAPDGLPVHCYSQSAILGENEGRGMDLLSPVWNYFDLTAAGRGDFVPRKNYAN